MCKPPPGSQSYKLVFIFTSLHSHNTEHQTPIHVANGGQMFPCHSISVQMFSKATELVCVDVQTSARMVEIYIHTRPILPLTCCVLFLKTRPNQCCSTSYTVNWYDFMYSVVRHVNITTFTHPFGFDVEHRSRTLQLSQRTLDSSAEMPASDSAGSCF
jgi:hypothetical protein